MTFLLTSATSSVQGDDSKVIQHKHKVKLVKAGSMYSLPFQMIALVTVRVTTIGYMGLVTGSDDNKPHSTGYRQSKDDWLHGIVYRWNDPNYSISYIDYYPTEGSVLNDRNYEKDQCEIEYMSDHSFSDGSAGYGRDNVLGYRTHYVFRSSSDYCRMAPLPSMASIRSQPEKQLIIDNTPSTSSEVSQSLLLLKNSSYLEYVKSRSSSVVKSAAKFNCEVFSKEERRKSNVAGTHGTEKLDVNISAAIRDATFLFTQLMLGSSTLCVSAIDEISRRSYRKSG